MKIFYLFLLIISFSFLSSTQEDIIDSTVELIKKGDVHELAKNFSSNIELTILDDENTYPKAQAELLLTDFFKHNSLKSVKILHRITSNPNYRFSVLILTTNNGTYRASFSLKSVKGQFELNVFRIEAENTK